MGPGDRIGHYLIERDLGAGAFATVWLARDELLDDPVAIKVLADNWARQDDVRRRFIDEAKIMRRIDHERIVRVFAVDELPSGQPMFVMTYADRGTLADRLRERNERAQRFSSSEIAALMIELAGCLAIVHDFGIVHRDLKPSNVLFRSARRHESTLTGGTDASLMVLADFGLAKDTIARSGFTQAAGTPAYMPPEQARTTAELDLRADVYSATAILFELATGVAPFDASTLSDVGRTRQQPALELTSHRGDLPREWQDVVRVGLDPDPERRFQTADELAEAVRSIDVHAGDSILDPRRRDPASRRQGDLSGLRGRVAALLDAFGAERSVTVDQRLDGPCRIAVVGSAQDAAEVRAAVESGSFGRFVVLHLAPTDVRVAESDVLVTGSGVTARSCADVLASSSAGPAVHVRLDEDPVADARDRLTGAIGTVDRRRDVVRASAALAQLDADVRRAGSVSLSESWVRIGDRVETLGFEVPEISDISGLRDEVAGRLLLPASRRTDLRRILFETDPGVRLGAPALPLADLVDVAGQVHADWRGYQDSGTVPFGARSAVDVVIRSLERLWLALRGHTA
ncbi:MAG: serine/threonine-protein kinase [Actinomycetota bacterium]